MYSIYTRGDPGEGGQCLGTNLQGCAYPAGAAPAASHSSKRLPVPPRRDGQPFRVCLVTWRSSCRNQLSDQMLLQRAAVLFSEGRDGPSELHLVAPRRGFHGCFSKQPGVLWSRPFRQGVFFLVLLGHAGIEPGACACSLPLHFSSCSKCKFNLEFESVILSVPLQAWTSSSGDQLVPSAMIDVHS